MSPVGWGVYITTFVFWVGIAHSGTLISAILFLFRAPWRQSIYRAAEAMTVFAVMTAGLFPLIHVGRVWHAYWLIPYPNSRFLWPNFKSPLVWDVFAVTTYFTTPDRITAALSAKRVNETKYLKCPACGDFPQFARNQQCRKCGAARPANVETFGEDQRGGKGGKKGGKKKKNKDVAPRTPTEWK